MSRCICKMFLSCFVILLLLFVMGMLNQAQAIPVNPPVDPPVNHPTFPFMATIDGPPGQRIVELMPGKGANPSIFSKEEVFQIGDYQWVVTESLGRSFDGEDFSISHPYTHVLLSFDIKTCEATADILAVPEPSSIILIASLLFGFVGVRKGQESSW